MKNDNATAEPKTEGGLRTRGGFGGRSEPGRPLVSVVTVCFNSEEHLEQTIKSVLGQTYDNIEYIIVDGGSSDGTLDIIRKYDDRIAYWVSEPDEGIYDAMNKGVSLSTGTLVGTINSNDWYAPDAVEHVVKASLEDPNAKVYHGNMYIIFAETGELHREARGTTENITRRFEMNHPTCFVRRGVYDDYRFRTELKVAADYDLMLRLHFAGKEFHHVDQPLVYFRIGGASSDYYRPRVEIYKLRKEYGMLSPAQYSRKRLLLMGKAFVRWFKAMVVRVFFKDNRDHPWVLKYVEYRDAFRRKKAAWRGRSSSGDSD